MTAIGRCACFLLALTGEREREENNQQLKTNQVSKRGDSRSGKKDREQ